ncbi:bile acid:sodium symporter family protein [Geofilum sp. OHC36d9]|uniref:bile acid:sodium symporter family protein n=1 Tax=Geofilum sp. OHC36d9 TaxID=3458413 RepID=UPI004034C21C
MKFLKFDKFVPALLAMIFIARVFPGPAVYDGPVTLHNVADVGITLIFFFYGLKLSPRKLRQDLGNWRLHLLVQLSTFVLFPLLVLPFFLAFGNGDSHLLWLGFFFLATLPSTVSSSVVMVSIARGNVPGAIFNATVSSLAGIFITPLLMGLVISAGPLSIGSLSGILLKLVSQVLMPVIVGLLLNRFWGHWAQNRAAFLKNFDQSVILLVVYLSFGKSFTAGYFDNTGWGDLLLVFMGTVALFFTVYFIVSRLAVRFRFSREDTITASFSGSKKSLIHGTVMSGVLFSGVAGTGLILLPLMIYHAMQLVVVGFLAKRFSKQKGN